MVSVQADAGFFKGPVWHAAAADIDLPQLRMIPGVHHFRASALQHLLHGLLHHLHIIRLDARKPVPVARLRPDLVRHAQENPHGPIRVHPRRTALLQLDRPDSGPGALQNVLQALPCLQLVLLLLLHKGVDIPQRENGAVLRRSILRGGKMDLQVLQPGGAVLYLVPDRELLLGLEPGKHIAFLRHRAEVLLVPGNHILRDIPLHRRRIAVLKIGRPIHFHLPAAAVNLTFARVEVHLIDAQIVHAEGVEHVIAPFLKLPDQVAPLQGRHNKVRRRLEHIGRIFQRLHGGIVHTIKADDLFSVIQGNHHKGMHALTLQVLVLKRIRLPDILQASDDDVLADAKLSIPACAHLRGDVLEALLFRLHPVGRPFIGVVVTAGLVLLKYVGPLSVQRISQILQQYRQRLVRRLLQQGSAKALVDDGLQVLNALYVAVPFLNPGSRSVLPSPIQTSLRIIHMPVLHIAPFPDHGSRSGFPCKEVLFWKAWFQNAGTVPLCSNGSSEKVIKIYVIISCVPQSCQSYAAENCTRAEQQVLCRKEAMPYY